jgi:hypothetical protein
MSWKNRLAGESEDPVVEQALRNFKASVDAYCEWAEVARSRPRAVKVARPAAAGWRMAAGWALGCVLAAGSLAGALYERQHRQELARIAATKAAAQKAAQERLAAEQRSASVTDQDLLATVDSDISRAVPAAMEPLAQMMDDKAADDNGTQ